jgi:hypothetical protein
MTTPVKHSVAVLRNLTGQADEKNDKKVEPNSGLAQAIYYMSSVMSPTYRTNFTLRFRHNLINIRGVLPHQFKRLD